MKKCKWGSPSPTCRVSPVAYVRLGGRSDRNHVSQTSLQNFKSILTKKIYAKHCADYTEPPPPPMRHQFYFCQARCGTDSNPKRCENRMSVFSTQRAMSWCLFNQSVLRSFVRWEEMLYVTFCPTPNSNLRSSERFRCGLIACTHTHTHTNTHTHTLEFVGWQICACTNTHTHTHTLSWPATVPSRKKQVYLRERERGGEIEWNSHLGTFERIACFGTDSLICPGKTIKNYHLTLFPSFYTKSLKLDCVTPTLLNKFVVCTISNENDWNFLSNIFGY